MSKTDIYYNQRNIACEKVNNLLQYVHMDITKDYLIYEGVMLIVGMFLIWKEMSKKSTTMV